MLKSLQISNYALIDKLEIEFDKGLTIITGETGAGKSIILGALSLLTGQRADSNVVRNKSRKCVVEVIFDIKNYDLKNIFSDNDIDYFDQTIIRREISAEGRSRAFVNDSPVNLNFLKQLSAFLIDIHSQHDTLLLNSAHYQIDALDSFAKNKAILQNYSELFSQYKTAQKQLHELKEKAQKEKADFDYYEFQYNQIAQANLNDGEQEELEEEQRQLSHIEEIKQNLALVNFYLNSEDNSVVTMLKNAVVKLSEIEDYLPKAKEFVERIENDLIDLQDLANESEVIEQDLEFDPARLEYVNSRLNTIYELQRKFNVPTVKELLDLQQDFAVKLEQINSFDDLIFEKEQQIKDLEVELDKLCNDLHEKRARSSKDFENQIINLLKNLGMPNAEFVVDIQQTKTYTETGKDAVTFLFSANKNVKPEAISRIASGGELSRLMLALKYIISQSKTLPTIIFDEIDTGISGEIAAKTGKLLRQMSENLQIINITHLPQVAAQGHHHFLVYKQDTEQGTSTGIRRLSENERIEEIAKMLSGTEVTQNTMQAAKELLENV